MNPDPGAPRKTSSTRSPGNGPGEGIDQEWIRDLQADALCMGACLQRLRIGVLIRYFEAAPLIGGTFTKHPTLSNYFGENYASGLLDYLNIHLLPDWARLEQRWVLGNGEGDQRQLQDLFETITRPGSKTSEIFSPLPHRHLGPVGTNRGYIDNLKNLHQEILGVTRALRDCYSQPSFLELRDECLRVEGMVDRCRSAYRELSLAYGNFASANFQSPTYGSSGGGQRGYAQSSWAGTNDYFRSGATAAVEAVEWRLASQLNNFGAPFVAARVNQSDQLLSPDFITTNSGMNALDLVLDYLKYLHSKAPEWQSKPKPKLLVSESMYFGTIQRIAFWCSQNGYEFCSAPAGDDDRLIELANDLVPFATFCEPLGNCFSRKLTDVNRLIEALSHENLVSKQGQMWGCRMNLVVDDTTVGPCLPWLRQPSSVWGRRVELFAKQSLIKYGQFGFDAVTAGAVRVWRKETAEGLRGLRAGKGCMPPQSTLEFLGVLNQSDVVLAKSGRHARNANLIAGALADIAKSGSAVVGEVAHPSLFSEGEKRKLHRGSVFGYGGLISLGCNAEKAARLLKANFAAGARPRGPISLEKHPDDSDRQVFLLNEVFLGVAFRLAHRADIKLDLGTSYGFHTTRFANYFRDAGSGGVNTPYIRISAGAENKRVAIGICEVLREAARIVDESLEKNEFTNLLQSK